MNNLTKEPMKILKILLLFVAIFACGEVACAQTFKVVGYTDKTASTERLNKDKAKFLGSKVILETFPNAIKVTLGAAEAQDRGFVMDKIDNVTYQISDGDKKGVLKLHTGVNYIRGGTFRVYKNNKLIGEIIFERDGVF